MEKKKKVKLIDIFLLIFGMFKIVLKPSDISPIFRGRSFRNHKSMKQTLESVQAVPEIAELIRTRYLSPKPFDLEELLNLPENSLGRTFAEHMKKNNLKVVFYPSLEDKEDDDISYLRKRARQTHDIHHVVLGYPAIDIGEMAISAFYLAQHRVPLSCMLIGVGFFIATFKQPHRIDELMEAIIMGWTMGKRAKPVMGIKWEELFHLPISEVRKIVNIEVQEEAFSKIGVAA